jgi:hypothetical protein
MRSQKQDRLAEDVMDEFESEIAPAIGALLTILSAREDCMTELRRMARRLHEDPERLANFKLMLSQLGVPSVSDETPESLVCRFGFFRAAPMVFAGRSH